MPQRGGGAETLPPEASPDWERARRGPSLQQALRTVGVPFVGLIVAVLAVSEFELASGSAAALQDIEAISIPAQPFTGGYVGTAQGCA